MTDEEIYSELLDIIKDNGEYKYKKHGNYVWLYNIVPDYHLCLDTWNSNVTVYKKDNWWISLGIDFGGFKIKRFWVNYFLAHLGKYRKL